MIKITLATLIGAGVIGTGAQTFTPQELNIAAGIVVFQVAGDGVHLNVADAADFSVTLTTKGQKAFTVRF